MLFLSYMFTAKLSGNHEEFLHTLWPHAFRLPLLEPQQGGEFVTMDVRRPCYIFNYKYWGVVHMPHTWVSGESGESLPPVRGFRGVRISFLLL